MLDFAAKSSGISYNKFLAKLASDQRKPNGQFAVTPDMGAAWVETLPVTRFHGVGVGSYRVPVTDISQGGIKIAIGEVGCINAPAMVAIDGLPTVEGVIRWFRDGQAGIAFNEPFAFDQLTRWLGMRLAGRREAASSGPEPGSLVVPENTAVRPMTVIRPLGEAIEGITGEVVPSPSQHRPYTAVIMMAGKTIAAIDVPTVIAGEAMIESVLESVGHLRQS